MHRKIDLTKVKSFYFFLFPFLPVVCFWVVSALPIKVGDTLSVVTILLTVVVFLSTILLFFYLLVKGQFLKTFILIIGAALSIYLLVFSASIEFIRSAPCFDIVPMSCPPGAQPNNPLYRNYQSTQPTHTVNTAPLPFYLPAHLDAANWKTYTNAYYGFNIHYPSGFALKVVADGGPGKAFDVSIDSLGQADPPSFDITVSVLQASSVQELQSMFRNSNECDKVSLACDKAMFTSKTIGGFNGLLVKVPTNDFADWEAFYFITPRGVLRFAGPDAFSYSTSTPWVGDEIVSTLEKI